MTKQRVVNSSDWRMFPGLCHVDLSQPQASAHGPGRELAAAILAEPKSNLS